MAGSCAEFLKADGGRILKKIDPISAGDLLGKTLAFANLAAMVQDPGVSVDHLRISFDLILECDENQLCGLGLGPEPEHILAWARKQKISDHRAADVARAILVWETLDTDFRSGRNQLDWMKTTPTKRAKAYRNWLRARCQDPKLKQVQKERARQLMKILDDEMPTDAAGPLKDCASILKAAAEGRLIPEKEFDRGYSQAAGRMHGVTDPQGDQFGALGKGFDGSSSGEGVVAGPRDPQIHPGGQLGQLTPMEVQPLAEALKMPLAAELRETIVGRKLLEFYESPPIKDSKGNILNEMNLAFQRFPDPKVMGAWDDVKVHFSLGYLEDWMKKSNQNPEKLMADKDAMAGLARTLAPVLVHEGTHQTQVAFFATQGIDKDLKNVEEEVGAAANGALFVEENFIRKGPGYVVNLSYLDTRLHQIYLEKGVEGLREDRNRTYLILAENSAFPSDQVTAEVFGNKKMRVKTQRVADYPEEPEYRRQIASEVSEQIDQYGRLVKKYQDDAGWFRSVRGQLRKLEAR